MINLADYQTQINEKIAEATQFKLDHNFRYNPVIVVMVGYDGKVTVGWNTDPNPKLNEWQTPKAHGWGYPDYQSYIQVWVCE